MGPRGLVLGVLLAGCADDVGLGGAGNETGEESTTASTSPPDGTTALSTGSTTLDTVGIDASSAGDDVSTSGDVVDGSTDGTGGSDTGGDDTGGMTFRCRRDGGEGPQRGTTTTGGGTGEGTTTTSGGNAAPQATADVLFATQEDLLSVPTEAGLLANDSDADGDVLAVTSFDPVSVEGGTVEVCSDGSLGYTPPPGYWGPDAFGYTVADDSGESASATATIYVAPVQAAMADVVDGVSAGFAIVGQSMGAWSGRQLAGAGDVDGDGRDDLLIASPTASPNGPTSGRAHVVFGKADTTPVQLGDITAGSGGFVIDGEATHDTAGSAVARAGDVNGDGLADLVVAADMADPNGDSSGRVYVVFGKTDTDPVQLSDVTGGVGGFAMDGEAPFDRAGWAIGGGGDVNGDGLDDVIIGAPYHDTSADNAGRAYVVFGRAETELVSLADLATGVGGFIIDAEPSPDRCGDAVAIAGDVDGDGLDDVVVGAPFAGRSYVVFGKADGETVSLTAVAGGVGGFAINGGGGGDDSGGAVGGAGDFDGDGLADVLIGARGSDVGGDFSGRAYLVFGTASTATVVLGDVAAGIGGFAMDGQAASHQLGAIVGGAGDVDGDGRDDILVGGSGVWERAITSGRGYVVLGRPRTEVVDLADVASGVGGFVIDGALGDTVGETVVAAGDVDGDGMDDVLVGAPGADPNDVLLAGRSYVMLGVPTHNTRTFCHRRPVPIPDDTPGGTELQLPAPFLGFIDDVNVTVEVTHPRLADLSLTVEHATAGAVTMFDDLGNGVDACEGADMRDVVFRDDSLNALICVEPGLPSLSGDYPPDEPMAAWTGAESGGVWTVTIADEVAPLTGTLDEVCVVIDAG